jgi:hypothetical protein
MSETMKTAPSHIWLQYPNKDSMSEWYGEITWCEDQQNDDDIGFVRADLFFGSVKKLNELLAAIENLHKQKGRHNTEIAYKRLIETFDRVKSYGKPEKSAEIEVPAIISYPTGSLGEEVAP